MIYIYKCKICSKQFEIQQGMNEPHIAFHCGQQARRIFTVPQTDKDLMYQFDTEIFGDKPVNIYSRRQYKRLLKQNDLVDATPKECLSVKPKTEADHKVRIKQFAKELTQKIHRQGAMPFIKGKLRDNDRIRESD